MIHQDNWDKATNRLFLVNTAEVKQIRILPVRIKQIGSTIHFIIGMQYGQRFFFQYMGNLFPVFSKREAGMVTVFIILLFFKSLKLITQSEEQGYPAGVVVDFSVGCYLELT